MQGEILYKNWTDPGDKNYYTEWTDAFPMENLHAESVTDIVTREGISRFGVPNEI